MVKTMTKACTNPTCITINRYEQNMMQRILSPEGIERGYRMRVRAETMEGRRIRQQRYPYGVPVLLYAGGLPHPPPETYSNPVLFNECLVNYTAATVYSYCRISVFLFQPPQYITPRAVFLHPLSLYTYFLPFLFPSTTYQCSWLMTTGRFWQ